MDEFTNLVRLEIENFQSIDYVEIPFNQTGVHWISGMPNVGKSAILKAIQALYKNISNFQYKEMIRDGEDFFRVKGYFGENDWVELIRGEGDRYSWAIDGNAGVMERTQGKVPFEVKEFYHLYWTGDKIRRYLNFTLVGDPLFFVETSQGDNTLILERALGTDRLTQVGKYSDSQKREVRSELRTLRKFHEESSETLEELTIEVNEERSKVELLDRLKEAIDQEVNVYNKIKKLQENTEKVLRIAEVVAQVQSDLDEVDVDYLDKEIKEYDKIKLLQDKEVRLLELKELEKELEHDITDEDLAELDVLVREHHEASRLVGKLKGLEDSYSKLKEEEKALEHGISDEELVELSKEVEEYDKLVYERNRLEKLSKDYEQMQEDLVIEQERYEELKQKQEDFLSQFEVCPFCERPMEDHEDGHKH